MSDCRYINGIRIFGFKSKEELVNYSLKKNKILIAVNAEKVYNSDEYLKSVINQNIGYADGDGAVWALKQKGIKNAVKIPGVELWLEFLSKFSNQKKFYFIGGKEEIIQDVVAKIRVGYPGIQLVGYRNGYFKGIETSNLIVDVAEKKPDIIFVAMGSPKQEHLMMELSRAHPALYLGLGGSFDVYSGRVKRAPEIFQYLKLEWFFRLIYEPKRIFRQIKLAQFAINLLLRKY